MLRITIESQHLNAQTEFNVSQDFISCLFTGVIAALPAFLEAFMQCLAGGGPTTGYQPGNRSRCAAPPTGAPNPFPKR